MNEQTTDVNKISTDVNKLFAAVNKLFTVLTNNIIFIYTPPKVGSTTLVTSLRVSLGKSYNVIHIHDEVMLSVLTGINDVTINDIILYLANIGKNVFVIDVYRTPIERKISEFFEKISPYHFNNTEFNIAHYSVDRIINRFNKVFPHIGNGDHYCDKYNIGGDPIPFDFTNKFTIQIINNIKYIKLRLCDSKFWPSILSSIFNADIVVIHDYHTADKSIGHLYTHFKHNYKLPSNYLERMKDDKYFNLYYNEKERCDYLMEWTHKTDFNRFIPYTDTEYSFYINLCLENQYINDIQAEHYIDGGCFCKPCSFKRREMFICAKAGETHFDKMNHANNIILYKATSTTTMTKKYTRNQFKLKFNDV
jgi:hypothetical protein